MDTLVNGKGRVSWGIYSEPVAKVNYEDYHLETPMGILYPPLLKKLLANQFHFIGIVGPELLAGIGVVDLKLLSNGFFYLFDRQTGELTETKKLAVLPSAVSIGTSPEKPRSSFKADPLSIEIRRESLNAVGSDLSLQVSFDQGGVSPLRICTRAGYRGWVYTQKTSPIRLKGSVTVRGRQHDLSSPAYWALSDWTCGYMRRQTCWNWASTAFSLADGRSLGMNLSCGVNETSFTENAFWVNGAMTKVDTVDFRFDPADLSSPWHIRSADGKVDLVFRPEAQRGERINAVLIASRFTQLFGVFEGTLQSDDGEVIRVDGCPGFAEDHYAKW
ncbi:MAG TPA: DUF2804 domain-containing protein [Deltaproteobacteria bacterium]|mgnify:CR=1 FL=1|jgi:hypothetical protein|nr:DUF2804 domain-containing protein [Deltaproteobacteria bacterium]HOI05698.1 DUF2804 domain-containing protein [Deltaproteobacteria bacterium]